MGTKRRGRLVMWASLVAALAVIVWGASYGPGYIKVSMYSRRIERGINPYGNLEALAEVGHPAAIGILEKYAMHPELGLGTSQAITLLCRHFPDSMMPRGVGAWEEIVGRSYGPPGRQIRQRSGRSSPVTSPVDRLREWLDDYPVHPGRDDVYLRLGFLLMESAPGKALEYLQRGFFAGDRDKRDTIANNFQRVLERSLSSDEILEMLDLPGNDRVRDNLLYVAALKRMRGFEFAAALSLFEASVEARGTQPLLLQGTMPRRKAAARTDDRPRRGEEASREKKLSAIDAQITVCRELKEEYEKLSATEDAESRAAILHAMARRCFKEPDLFLNHLYYEYPLGNHASRTSQLALEEIHDANHFRQAAMLFKRIVREYPSYSRLHEVEHSIPLCAWRIRRAWHISIGGSVDHEIWTGFQAFADKYPENSMADDALYLAAIHHRQAYGPKETSKIVENMQRIARDHPDGDIVKRYGQTNRFLAQALERERLGK